VCPDFDCGGKKDGGIKHLLMNHIKSQAAEIAAWLS
jgi:hypothetical protein